MTTFLTISESRSSAFMKDVLSIKPIFRHFANSRYANLVNSRINQLGKFGEALSGEVLGLPKNGKGLAGDFTLISGESVEAKTTISRVNPKDEEYIDFNTTRSIKENTNYDFYFLTVIRPNKIDTYLIPAKSLSEFTQNRVSMQMVTLKISQLEELSCLTMI